MIAEKGSAEEKPSWFELLKYYSIEMDLFGYVRFCSLPFIVASHSYLTFSFLH